MPGRPQRPITRSNPISASTGRNRNRPPNLVRTVRGSRLKARTSARSAAVGLVPGGRSSSMPRQPGKAFLPEHRGHGHRSSRDAVFLQGLADIVDRLVLLAEFDDLLSNDVVCLGPWARRLGEELAVGLTAELMHQLVQSAEGVSEAPGDLRAGQAIDEIGPQGFILPVGRVAGSEKELSQIH